MIDPLEVDRAADRLVAMDALDRRFFAIKANAHEGILRRLYAKASATSASPRVRLPTCSGSSQTSQERLLYTPNFARADYVLGLEADAMVTIDNAH